MAEEIEQVADPQPKEFDPNLHMQDLRGKDYLGVAPRIIWFREGGIGKKAHTIEDGWAIITELVSGGLESEHATVKASVITPGGVVVATGYKTEDKRGFADFVEKAETGAIGRALGLSGFGTLQAQEFDEGGDVCDSPRPKKGKGGNGGSKGDPKCSKCNTPINQARVVFCKAKKLDPPVCTNCA